MNSARQTIVLSLAAAALGLFFGPLALAQSKEAGDEQPKPAFYETTTVTARPLVSASSGVTLVTTESIEASLARSAADAAKAPASLC